MPQVEIFRLQYEIFLNNKFSMIITRPGTIPWPKYKSRLPEIEQIFERESINIEQTKLLHCRHLDVTNRLSYGKLDIGNFRSMMFMQTYEHPGTSSEPLIDPSAP